MARTEQRPRKNGSPSGEKLAKRGRASSEKGNSQGAPPPSKKAKKNHSSPSLTNNSSTSQAQPSAADSSKGNGTSNVAASESLSIKTPPLLEDLAKTHEVTNMNIISSSHIRQKVIVVLEQLATVPAAIPPAKPKVVMLHSKAPVASKIITIAEIAKREIAKNGGKWFQYNKVEQVMVEIKEVPRKTDSKEDNSSKTGGKEKSSEDGDEESEEETTAFETMKTPFERANEGKPKMRAVPVMTLYLSRFRLDSLRNAYGEQTNALQVPL